MLKGGEDPLFIARYVLNLQANIRRMVIFASEDVGLVLSFEIVLT